MSEIDSRTAAVLLRYHYCPPGRVPRWVKTHPQYLSGSASPLNFAKMQSDLWAAIPDEPQQDDEVLVAASLLKHWKFTSFRCVPQWATNHPWFPSSLSGQHRKEELFLWKKIPITKSEK